MKKCCKCKEYLFEKNFNRDNSTYDKLQGACRKCQKEYNKERNFPPNEDPTRIKICAGCKEGKQATLENFSPQNTSKDGFSYHCKKCQSKISMKSQRKNLEQSREIRHKTKMKQILRSLGMTEVEYLDLVNQQKSKCAICGRDENSLSGRNKRLVIDHNHHTGLHRGLLCFRCNTALGLFFEDPEIMESAIEYIKKWNTSKQNI